MADNSEVLSKLLQEISCSIDDTARGVSLDSLLVELSKVEQKSGVRQSTKLETSREILAPTGPEEKTGQVLMHSKPLGPADDDSGTYCT